MANYYVERERESSRYSGRIIGYALKCDIARFFDTIDHATLMALLACRIKDADVLGLIKVIIDAHKAPVPGKGMPLGNLTSQFFANFYLHALDLFVKHRLKARYYLRYVDDFVILHRDRTVLEGWKKQISEFCIMRLKIRLHPQKCAIVPLSRGLTLLGFRIFPRHRLLKKSNARRIWARLERLKKKCDAQTLTPVQAWRSVEGWPAYASFARTYVLRKKVVRRFRDIFQSQTPAACFRGPTESMRGGWR